MCGDAERGMISMMDRNDKAGYVCVLVSHLLMPNSSCVGDTRTFSGIVKGGDEKGRR